MKSQEANVRQLEIWKKTIRYELEMMAPQSMAACDDFLMRLQLFEKQLEAQTKQTMLLVAEAQRTG
ncbi:hypothetical protein ACAF76_021405 [Brevibacillus sp. TJ4]|uniref:hypothetical protein n=1 Tax=Brevibacillus sp. TJ4 TaxID=3234853 RepID=UPI003BA2E94E